MKRTLAAVLALTAVLTLPLRAASPDDSPLPAPFAKHVQRARVHMSYGMWSYMLHATVFAAGRSFRETPGMPPPQKGSHFVLGNSSSYRYEGNRLYIGAFKGDQLTTLIACRKWLEALPAKVPMAHWTRRQQLAYWLNLYNATMVELLARHYPERSLEKLLYGVEGRGDGLLDQKLLTVAGVNLSLNDIQYRILTPLWHDPLILYGLFKGYVGSPNIRREAYTADNVYKLLKDNAGEFVNSNRGARIYGHTLRVSVLYRENAALFPDFEADLKAHLANYADHYLSGQLPVVTRIKATTHDYYTADLLQGIAHASNPNDNAGAAALGDRGDVAAAKADAGLSRWPKYVREYATHINQRRARHHGHVTVEEVQDKQKPAPAPKEEEPQK